MVVTLDMDAGLVQNNDVDASSVIVTLPDDAAVVTVEDDSSVVVIVTDLDSGTTVEDTDAAVVVTDDDAGDAVADAGPTGTGGGVDAGEDDFNAVCADSRGWANWLSVEEQESIMTAGISTQQEACIVSSFPDLAPRHIVETCEAHLAAATTCEEYAERWQDCLDCWHEWLEHHSQLLLHVPDLRNGPRPPWR
jgi:hypothetical protein